MRIGLVSDSTADIPVDIQGKYGIEVVPAIININGQSFQDGRDISREEFYTRLPGMKPPPTTSAPSVGAFQEKYERLLSGGMDQVISIHAANSLSGIFNAARLAAQEFNDRVHVIDGGQLSLGTGYQVLTAAEGIRAGALLEEILNRVSSVQKKVRVVALLESLEYIRRSGRVSWAKAMLGNLLRIQPLVELRYGVVHRLGQVRTRLQGISRLKDILHSFGPLERLAVLHTNAESAARHLLDEIKIHVPDLPFIVNVTTAIGTHVGPNGIGLAAVPIE